MGLFAVVLLTLFSLRQTKTALARDRALVSLMEFERDTVVSDGKVTGIRVNVVWKNTGRTPAISVRMRTIVMTVPGGPVPHRAMEWPDDAPIGVLGPGAIQKSAVESLSMPKLRAIMERRDQVVFYTAVEYRDTFSKDSDDPHRTVETNKLVISGISPEAFDDPGKLDVRNLSFIKCGTQ